VAASPEKALVPKPEVIQADVVMCEQPHTQRMRVLRFVQLRAQGLRNTEIAEILGITPHTLNTYICRAAKDGWLKFTDPMERFAMEIVPKVVDNIEYYIDKKDKTMTIEAAKGGGIFKNYQAIKMETNAPQAVLALKIETISPDRQKVISAGNIVGKAKELEGEVVDAE